MNNFDTINKLVTDNIKLVYFYANKAKDLDNHEAISWGMAGLFKAAESYNAKRGSPFGTFASYKIKWKLQSLREFIRQKKRGFNVPKVSLDRLIDQRDTAKFECHIPDENMPDASELVSRLEDIEITKKFLNRLTNEQRYIIYSHFGLGAHKELSFQQIGKLLGKSKQRIQIIEATALKFLREKILEAGYNKYTK